jgi:hypothetical protein
MRIWWRRRAADLTKIWGAEMLMAAWVYVF